MIVRKMAMSAVLAALLVAVKFAFGFVPGIELTTLFVCLYGLFLPLVWSMTTVSVAIVCIGAIYGFGTWWIMYWFIFPTEVLLTWVFRKFLQKNNLIFSLWTAFWGFSILFWYAGYDLVLFGPSMALTNMTSGVVTNSIEAAANFVGGLLLFYPTQKIFNMSLKNQANYIW